MKHQKIVLVSDGYHIKDDGGISEIGPKSIMFYNYIPSLKLFIISYLSHFITLKALQKALCTHGLN